MVKKKNGKWQMCIDFTDINKCYPKDDFPLARIDQIVDSAAGSEVMALIDCFSSYHQIWLPPEDEEKTSFITPFITYCYLRMPEGLRNAEHTFCRNVLSNVDDIVVVSKKKENYIADLAKTSVHM
jgi:hypothetical protein